MAEQEKKAGEKPYIKEKIVKRRTSPVQWVVRIIALILASAVCGAVACLSFYLVKPLVEPPVPMETTVAPTVELPTYNQATQEAVTTEATPETEMPTVDEMEISFTPEQKTWIQSQIISRVDSHKLSLDDVQQQDQLLRNVAKNASFAMAIITGYRATEDGRRESIWQTQAVAFYRNEESHEILYLADLNAMGDADEITAMLGSNEDNIHPVTVKGRDHVYGLAVLSISTEGWTKERVAGVNILSLGNNYIMSSTDTILFIGRPYEVVNSVAIGHVVAMERNLQALDSEYQLFITDCQLPETGMGFMINLSGELVGVYKPALRKNSAVGYAVALGTGDISDELTCMSNGRTASLLGVYGRNVTKELQEQGMPAGVYVSEVQVDGPAFKAGISAGDIIAGISQSVIPDLTALTKELTGNHLPGESVIVTIYREGPDGYKPMEITVALGAR